LRESTGAAHLPSERTAPGVAVSHVQEATLARDSELRGEIDVERLRLWQAGAAGQVPVLQGEHGQGAVCARGVLVHGVDAQAIVELTDQIHEERPRP
jgi:tRNA(Ile2) C34 agmatinyltransferase TiaS